VCIKTNKSWLNEKEKCLGKDNELKSANRKRKLHDELSLLVEHKIIPREIKV
jgi:hypothetical protein